MRLLSFLWNLYPRQQRRVRVRQLGSLLQKLRAETDEGRFLGD